MYIYHWDSEFIPYRPVKPVRRRHWPNFVLGGRPERERASSSQNTFTTPNHRGSGLVAPKLPRRRCVAHF